MLRPCPPVGLCTCAASREHCKHPCKIYEDRTEHTATNEDPPNTELVRDALIQAPFHQRANFGDLDVRNLRDVTQAFVEVLAVIYDFLQVGRVSIQRHEPEFGVL